MIQVDKGTRLVAGVVGRPPDQVPVGQPVTVEFFDAGDGQTLPRTSCNQLAGVQHVLVTAGGAVPTSGVIPGQGGRPPAPTVTTPAPFP